MSLKGRSWQAGTLDLEAETHMGKYPDFVRLATRLTTTDTTTMKNTISAWLVTRNETLS